MRRYNEGICDEMKKRGSLYDTIGLYDIKILYIKMKREKIRIDEPISD